MPLMETVSAGACLSSRADDGRTNVGRSWWPPGGLVWRRMTNKGGINLSLLVPIPNGGWKRSGVVLGIRASSGGGPMRAKLSSVCRVGISTILLRPGFSL
ncbi:hypothetical protein RchiOBHm_Chr0c45g0503851 [Rosa chinensis]|uniref:Uncharacterized protein n=1 Tax=Rosa chinensis TaxID=74649 RepID=A0A2P6SPZ0_ROSCH|nr:hypothetical protein RchiOBHm_Chr0c45g0503851 [Rosa chinensis]